MLSIVFVRVLGAQQNVQTFGGVERVLAILFCVMCLQTHKRTTSTNKHTRENRSEEEEEAEE